MGEGERKAHLKGRGVTDVAPLDERIGEMPAMCGVRDSEAIKAVLVSEEIPGAQDTGCGVDERAGGSSGPGRGDGMEGVGGDASGGRGLTCPCRTRPGGEIVLSTSVLWRSGGCGARGHDGLPATTLTCSASSQRTTKVYLPLFCLQPSTPDLPRRPTPCNHTPPTHPPTPGSLHCMPCCVHHLHSPSAQTCTSCSPCLDTLC